MQDDQVADSKPAAVAAIGTPGGSSTRACAGVEAVEEQVDEENDSSTPLFGRRGARGRVNVCDSQPVEQDRSLASLLGGIDGGDSAS